MNTANGREYSQDYPCRDEHTMDLVIRKHVVHSGTSGAGAVE
jgi:hypothetical protein